MLQLNYKKFGEGKPLIILHGLLGSLDNWQTLAKKYVENFKVYIIDQRNHGKSPHTDNFNYDLLAEDLYDFFEEHNIENAYVLGHSMGGKTAMKFATDFPHLVEKLIVADIAPVTYKPGHEMIFKALLSANMESAESRKDVENDVAKYVKDFGVRQFLLKGLTRNENRNFVWKFNVKSLWVNYQFILNHFEVNKPFEKPTLFIKGEKSNYIKDSYKAEILDIFPKAEFDIINGVGHWLHAEKPELFLEKTLTFLNN